MIPQSCKRLAEVDFPIAVVSRHSATEKSIRHGHPSTLHLWWARRPLAACRAMLMALLLPDPADAECPERFKAQARKALAAFPPFSEKARRHAKSDVGLREELLSFIGSFANWDVAADRDYLATARALVKAAHGDETPLVVDPFSGGGSIPLEALRVGCDAFASDLNPVACLILKTMLEDIPRGGVDLADELRKAGEEIKAAAQKELAQFYPADEDGATPIAYLWARTVRCEAVGCGAEIPLVRSFWLSRKPHRRRALRYQVHPGSPRKGTPPWVDFEVFCPRADQEVPPGTVTRAKATCPACREVLSPERVRAQLAAQRGGADVVFDRKGQRIGGARLLAVVTLVAGQDGRQYRVGTDNDYAVVRRAQRRLAKIADTKLPNGLSVIPDEPLPPVGTLGFRVQRYGMLAWGDLFTARQKLALVSFCRLLSGVPQSVASLAAIALDRIADRGSTACRWDSSPTSEVVKNTFSRQALPLVWDFAEVGIFSDSTGNIDSVFQFIAEVCSSTLPTRDGQVQQSDATALPLPSESSRVWFTDPPYYDAIPYSDLSDFFYVWLKRALPAKALLRDPFDRSNPLTPKAREAVQDETRQFEGEPKDRAFFERVMAKAFAEGRRVLSEDGIGSVVFAHKTTEGWEALLGGLVAGGWTITGSWPISTEMATRLRARESAALSASIHLVCRPRAADAGIGDWSDVARELPKRVGDWMERLSKEGVRGADLVFACIGPAMEVYSRYSRVEDSAGREIPLGGNPEAREPHRRGFLAYVWEMVGRAALNQVLGTGDARPRDAAGGLEEDARLTALFLWTLQATASDSAAARDEPDQAEADEDDEGGGRSPRRSGFSLVFDVVRRFAQPLGIHLPDWEGRIVETDKGLVRLLPVSERAALLFGRDGAEAVATRIERGVRSGRQMALDFLGDGAPEPEPARPRGRGRGRSVSDEDLATPREATTLDRVHAAMLLQSAGRAHALRAFLAAEHERGTDFVRLANALSALYPKDSDEKRLVDAMLLAMPK